jgi:DNA polymerase-1
MGKIALLALSNFHYEDILSRRGSQMLSFTRRKMIPTLHPSFYMRGEWRYKPIFKFDIARAVEHSSSPELRLPERHYYVAPESIVEVEDWVQKLGKAKELSFDIEMVRGGWISCIAFSCDPSEAYCIPLSHTDRRPYWYPHEELQVWRLLQWLLNRPQARYITQNGLFDCWGLWTHGLTAGYMTRGYDTLLMHKLLCPDLPHDLAFLTSIYTDEPYYKDESGGWDREIPVPDEQFWIYNCKDAAVTLEISRVLKQELDENQMLHNYSTEIQAQWDIILQMRQRGIRVDKTKLASVSAQVEEEIATLSQKLEAILGWLPNTQSSKSMEKLYAQLNVKATPTASGGVSRDKEQLMQLAHKYPAAREILMLVKDLNALRTLKQGFLGMVTDASGFYHPEYKLLGTKSRRLAGRGSDAGGPQLQNIPPKLRSVFIPD